MNSFFARNLDHFHFVGIGGIGMSAIAELLLKSGFQVSGSDASDSPILQRLRDLGVGVKVGHARRHLEQARIVVYSSAIGKDNPELQEAHDRGIPVVHRSEMLAEMARFRTGIAVSGTHGKTTTSAMIARVLEETGLDPTAVIGSYVREWGCNARLGQGPFFVFEADESDRSFVRSPSVYSVVTNIDFDHMDHYRDEADLTDTFSRFMNKVPFYGWVAACAEDSRLGQSLKNVHREVITYGLGEEAAVLARNVDLQGFRCGYDCYLKDRELGRVQLNVPGLHNALNSLAAVVVALQLEIPFPRIAEALSRFQGTERRLQWKGDRNGVRVVDDYAHHPTEIKATLEACRPAGRRLIVVYQPHRYSRTEYLMDKMAGCFAGVARLYLIDIYGAGEEPVPGVTSEVLAASIAKHRTVEFVPNRADLLVRLRSETRPGDLLLTLGAGDVGRVGEEFLEQEEKN